MSGRLLRTGGDSVRGFLSAQNGIFHRVVIPLAVAAGGVDVLRFEVAEELRKVRLTVLIEDDVGVFNVENMPRQDAITFVQDAAFLQVSNRPVSGLLDIDLFFRRMRDLNID